MSGKNPFQNLIVPYGVGDSIFEEGDAGTTMYIVQRGAVQLYRRLDGKRQDLAKMEKGDFFGEMSVLEGLPRTHSAVAAEDSELIEINSTTFDKMIRSNIEIAVRMLRKLSIRLRDVERRLERATVAPSAGEVPQIEKEDQTLQLNPPAGLRLECVEEGVQFALNPHETLVGRYDPVTEVRPDIDLTDVDLKRSVSRRHARIIQTNGGYSIVEEVGALNGTFVNGQQLTPGEPRPLEEGDEISFGMVSTFFRN